MLETIIVVLVILWLLGFGLHIGGGLIHILLVVALIVVVVRLLSGRRALWLSWFTISDLPDKWNLRGFDSGPLRSASIWVISRVGP